MYLVFHENVNITHIWAPIDKRFGICCGPFEAKEIPIRIENQPIDNQHVIPRIRPPNK